MKGRSHFTLSLLSLVVFTYPFWLDLSPVTWLGIYAGLLTGSLAPDVDAPDAVIFHLRLLPRELRALLSLFGYLLRYLVYLPLSFLFWMILSRSYRHEHRGLLHTPVGVTLASLLVLGYTTFVFLLLARPLSLSLLLLAVAFWAGCLLHLLQDSCTPGGIAWVFPLHCRRLRGTIRTDNRTDPRPLLYAGILLGCLVFLILMPDLPSPIMGGIAMLTLIGVWSLFLVLAGTSLGST
ncbi:MAG: metal-dependent hydrolase [Methanomicrobiales archaeon]|nr:metal-dependent hydrolase [Methanomicrobiales archaeon]